MEYCSHDAPPVHHLIYKEELKKDADQTIVICSLCNKPIWGSLHNCVECRNLPVHSYSSDKNHCLDFTEKLENEVVCSMCDEPLLGPAYRCPVSKCNFVIHKSCTQLSLKINHPLHPNHTIFLQYPGGNYCDACCRSHEKSMFYKCHSCEFQLDIECANYRLPINANDCHPHEFFPIWKRIQFNCEACGEEITNLTYKVCNICKLLVHYRCAKIPRIVRIKLHNHFLNLVYSPLEIKNCDAMLCGICDNKINTKHAAYYCHECSYILHTECLRRFIDVYGELPATSELVLNKSVRYTTHRIKALNHAKDEGPHPKEINHFSHQQHKLFLYDDEVKDDKVCNGCMEFIISAPFYRCENCNFFLHIQCTKLPTTIERHQLHPFHTLTLLPWAPTDSGVFFCYICSRHHRGFAYKCVIPWCQETFDSQCSSISKTLQHEGHQHNLFLHPYSHRTCKACPKENIKKHAFVCTNCDFILGIKCANLPLVARNKYDTHFFRLTYSAKDDSEEYYCLICEEKRDPNHWFYYCAKCDFSAHSECVIENEYSVGLFV